MITALKFLLENICVRFGNNVYRQIIGIPMGTNCASLIADYFCIFMNLSLWRKLAKTP